MKAKPGEQSRFKGFVGIRRCVAWFVTLEPRPCGSIGCKKSADRFLPAESLL